VPGVKAHFFSSAGQFVNRLIDEDFVRSAVSTVNRWPSALTHTGVKCDPGIREIQLKQWTNGIDAEGRRGMNLRRHQPVSHRDIEQFVVAEPRQPPFGRRNLGFRSLPRKRHHLDFRPPGFIGEIGKPVAVERKSALIFAGLQSGRSRRQEANSNWRKHPVWCTSA